MNVSQVGQMKEILQKKHKGNFEVNILEGAKHGFASRTDPNDKNEIEYANQAEAQAIAWFKRWFASQLLLSEASNPRFSETRILSLYAAAAQLLWGGRLLIQYTLSLQFFNISMLPVHSLSNYRGS